MENVQAVLQQPNGSTQQQQQQQQQYAAPTVVPQARLLTFVHPGTLMGPAEVQLLRQRASGAVAADDAWRQVCR
jgi:hypothetical protein